MREEQETDMLQRIRCRLIREPTFPGWFLNFKKQLRDRY